jgi:hypothetical protein
MQVNFVYYKNKLEEAGVIFDIGMNESEIAAAENFYKFKFPPDIKDFLMFALPVSKGWTNWRKLGSPEIDDAFSWIYEGIYFDIENNAFWLDDWCEKPKNLSEAFSIAKQKIDEAPKLIPIIGHRYIPDFPNERNNPVFSVYQTDIIYYGSNLWNYFENEFHYYFKTQSYQIKQPIRHIEFWSLFAEDLI